MTSTRMRPFEARMAALRAAKSPGCGCGHAHGKDDAAAHTHEPQSPQSAQKLDSADSARSAASSVVTKEAA